MNRSLVQLRVNVTLSALALCLFANDAMATDARCVGGTLPSSQTAPTDSPMIFIRENCCDLADQFRPYCFDNRVGTNVLSQVNDWLNMSGSQTSGLRHPSASFPITIDIGEGDFSGEITCKDANVEALRSAQSSTSTARARTSGHLISACSIKWA
jgi:hypothetical protein